MMAMQILCGGNHYDGNVNVITNNNTNGDDEFGEEDTKWLPLDRTRQGAKSVLPKTQATIDVLATLNLHIHSTLFVHQPVIAYVVLYSHVILYLYLYVYSYK